MHTHINNTRCLATETCLHVDFTQHIVHWIFQYLSFLNSCRWILNKAKGTIRTVEKWWHKMRSCKANILSRSYVFSASPLITKHSYISTKHAMCNLFVVKHSPQSWYTSVWHAPINIKPKETNRCVWLYDAFVAQFSYFALCLPNVTAAR